MSQEKTNNQYQAVSSVGNAWIVTDSKSHPGYVYYFNTVTGEAVWNLSDEEIEKARLRTRIMECKQGSKPTMCPEPKTNPPPKPLIKYNKKYRFGEQHQRNIHQQPEINMISTQSPGSIYSDMAINNISAFDLNALNTQLNAFNVISTPTIYNSHAWAVPRTPQFVLTPTIPVVNQSQASLNIAYNQLLKNKQAQSTKFNYFQNGPKRQNRLLQNRVNVRPEIQRNFKGLPVKKSDLRERILSRRRLNSNSNQTQSYSTNEDAEDENDVAGEELNSYETTTVVENDSSNIENDDTVYKLDLEPLKKYLSFSQANSNVWYIVVDMNMLLKEFHFIKLITESDDHCKLMVPENVMTELKDFIASSNDIPARRIYHSLTGLIEMGVALVDENRSQDYGNTITNPILKTCFGLLEENYDVILLSEDSELLKLKKIIKLHMLNIEEIKSLLKENPSLCPSQQTSNSGFKLSEITRLSNDKNTSNIVVRPKTLSTKTKEPVIADVASDIHMPENSKASEAVSLRCTADAAIQTETFNNRDKEIDVHSDCNHAQNTIEKLQNSKTMPSNSQSVHINTPGKRREIKLKRSISNPTPVVGLTQNNEKKFRWRRKRNPNNLGDKLIPNNAKTPSPEKVSKVISSPTHFDSMELDTQIEQAELPNNNITDHTSNLGDVIESSESSVICVNTRNRNFIVVEESSTSGVISNSESNIDIDYQICGEDENDSNDISNYIVVYEVENEIMEESLQTKREEWISRFMQIMEEVLTVILHEKPMFLNTALPPPWTLHEAVQCIRKYSNNSAVKVSTDKLSSILFDLSDKRGKINMNMTPSEYMTMYSSGITLLRVIKDNISNCEDIDIAEFSLQKLLNDIKNPYCESEVDPHDNSINVEETHSVDDLAGGNSLENEPGTRKENYNQRSIMKNTEKVSEISPIKATRNTVEKSNKFSKWNLKSITRKITNTRETNTHSCNEDVTDSQYITFTKDTDKETVSDEPSNAPNIVRKFVKCREFEERLNINTEDEILDYDDEYHSQIDDSHEVANELNVTESHDTDDIFIGHDMVTSSLKTVNSSSLSNNVFKLMMRMCLQEVRNALNEVKTLCDRCYEELENPKLDSKERNILIKRVESAESHIVGLCISLQSMLDRDPNAPSDNIQNALKKAGINISDIDEPLLLQYWDTIANSKKQADVFLNSIREIIADLKCPS